MDTDLRHEILLPRAPVIHLLLKSFGICFDLLLPDCAKPNEALDINRSRISLVFYLKLEPV
jgi:hypothetical protein